ncbi:MAG: TrmH family RNA methyltransferase [Candidatus Bipolaricaulia bacterium]
MVSSHKRSKNQFWVLAHNIRSMYNVGSFFRTADGAGVDKIILGGYTAHPPRPQISKTALRAEESVPWEKVTQAWRRVDELKRQGFYIVALENNVTGSQNLFDAQLHFPLLLMLGNEVNGLTNGLLKRADLIAAIPMLGKKESLNVAVAFGIAAYTVKLRLYPVSKVFEDLIPKQRC